MLILNNLNYLIQNTEIANWEIKTIMTVSQRKSEHIKISLNENVRFKNKLTGFEEYDFIHCALPEINYKDISTETEFLGKLIAFPLMVSAITGGYRGAFETNKILAQICQDQKIAMGVGSQRQILENSHYLNTFSIVRKVAPTIPIIGNIGASQIIQKKDISIYKQMVDLIEADAMAIHLNPLQELVQPEGNTRFKGVLRGIEWLVKHLEVPIIIKEVGCGISRSVGEQLEQIGIKYIDLAGAGGTSWVGIESFRGAKQHLTDKFWDWGIPTAKCLESISEIKNITIIASGGIEDGITLAKALALGAQLVGAALPLLKALKQKKEKGLITLIESWREELRTVMFLTGCENINELKHKQIIQKR